VPLAVSLFFLYPDQSHPLPSPTGQKEREAAQAEGKRKGIWRFQIDPNDIHNFGSNLVFCPPSPLTPLTGLARLFPWDMQMVLSGIPARSPGGLYHQRKPDNI